MRAWIQLSGALNTLLHVTTHITLHACAPELWVLMGMIEPLAPLGTCPLSSKMLYCWEWAICLRCVGWGSFESNCVDLEPFLQLVPFTNTWSFDKRVFTFSEFAHSISTLRVPWLLNTSCLVHSTNVPLCASVCVNLFLQSGSCGLFWVVIGCPGKTSVLAHCRQQGHQKDLDIYGGGGLQLGWAQHSSLELCRLSA